MVPSTRRVPSTLLRNVAETEQRVLGAESKKYPPLPKKAGDENVLVGGEYLLRERKTNLEVIRLVQASNSTVIPDSCPTQPYEQLVSLNFSKTLLITTTHMSPSPKPSYDIRQKDDTQVTQPYESLVPLNFDTQVSAAYRLQPRTTHHHSLSVSATRNFKSIHFRGLGYIPTHLEFLSTPSVCVVASKTQSILIYPNI